MHMYCVNIGSHNIHNYMHVQAFKDKGKDYMLHAYEGLLIILITSRVPINKKELG